MPRGDRYLTLEEFEEWIASRKADIRIYPYRILRCECGDVNCKGWRLVGTAT